MLKIKLPCCRHDAAADDTRKPLRLLPRKRLLSRCCTPPWPKIIGMQKLNRLHLTFWPLRQNTLHSPPAQCIINEVFQNKPGIRPPSRAPQSWGGWITAACFGLLSAAVSSKLVVLFWFWFTENKSQRRTSSRQPWIVRPAQAYPDSVLALLDDRDNGANYDLTVCIQPIPDRTIVRENLCADLFWNNIWITPESVL